jgi:hypothetical protein
MSSTDTPVFGQEVGEARRVQDAGHADDLFLGQARELLQGPDHGVERVGDADDEGVGGVGLDAFADGLHDLQVDAQQVVAAHARLARHAGGDDADVGAGDVGIVVDALQRDVLAEHGRGFGDVQGLALGVPSAMSNSRMSPSSSRAAMWARVPPIMPAPMRAIFARAMGSPSRLWTRMSGAVYARCGSVSSPLSRFAAVRQNCLNNDKRTQG